MHKWSLLFLFLYSHCQWEHPGSFEAICSNFEGKFDYAIIEGKVIDGTGSPARVADILVKGDSIVYVGPVDTSRIQAKMIYATGRLVTPGFIDVHAHGDPFEDDFSNFLSMGVTTIVLGQDGRSPVSAFEDPNSFFDSLQQKNSMINLAFLSGHGDIRQKVHNGKHSKLSAEELSEMLRLLRTEMIAGTFGLSTGLEYFPGFLADRQELDSLALIVSHEQGLIMSHLRSEDDDKMNASINELLAQGQHCQVHVSHLKVVYGQQESRAEEILDLLKKAGESGIEVSADVYPYAASYTGIGIVFPEWAKTRSDFENAIQTRQQELREFLYQKIMDRNGPEATLFATRPFTGKTLAEVANESGQDFVEILLKIGPAGASGAYFVMNESIQERFIVDPNTMISSDGGPNLRHPRSYGAFAKIIQKFVIEEKKLSLESAIRKMTSLSAETVHLTNRGALKPGYKADILIFHPEEIEANSTYENPFETATGFSTVMVNGALVKDQNKIMHWDAGRILRK